MATSTIPILNSPITPLTDEDNFTYKVINFDINSRKFSTGDLLKLKITNITEDNVITEGNYFYSKNGEYCEFPHSGALRIVFEQVQFSNSEILIECDSDFIYESHNNTNFSSSLTYNLKLEILDSTDLDSFREDLSKNEVSRNEIEQISKERQIEGNLLYGKARYQKAIKYYRNALAILGLNEQDHPKISEEKFKNLLEFYYDIIFKCLNNLSACYMQLESFTEALDILDKVECLDQENIKMLWRTGRACLNIDQLEKAREYLVKARTLDPESSVIKRDLGKVEEKLGNEEATHKVAQNIIEMDVQEHISNEASPVLSEAEDFDPLDMVSEAPPTWDGTVSQQTVQQADSESSESETEDFDPLDMVSEAPHTWDGTVSQQTAQQAESGSSESETEEFDPLDMVSETPATWDGTVTQKEEPEQSSESEAGDFDPLDMVSQAPPTWDGNITEKQSLIPDDKEEEEDFDPLDMVSDTPPTWDGKVTSQNAVNNNPHTVSSVLSNYSNTSEFDQNLVQNTNVTQVENTCMAHSLTQQLEELDSMLEAPKVELEEIDENQYKERSRNTSGADDNNRHTSGEIVDDGSISLVSSCSTISEQNPYAPLEDESQKTETIFQREPSTKDENENDVEINSVITVASVSSSVLESEQQEQEEAVEQEIESKMEDSAWEVIDAEKSVHLNTNEVEDSPLEQPIKSDKPIILEEIEIQQEEQATKVATEMQCGTCLYDNGNEEKVKEIVQPTLEEVKENEKVEEEKVEGPEGKPKSNNLPIIIAGVAVLAGVMFLVMKKK